MNYKQIQEIITNFESSTLRELELEMEGFKIRLSKNDSSSNALVSKPVREETVKSANSEVKDNEVVEVKETGNFVLAPLVGTFYESSGPGKASFVKVGDQVKKDDVLFIIEAMKIMNEIVAPQDGVVKEIYVKNGDAVGFDQKIMKIE